MFDFSLGELLLIAAVALVCIGPKELPVVLRACARAMRSMREVSREVREAFDDLAAEAGLKDDVKTITGDDGKPYLAYDIDHFIKPGTPPGRPRGDA